MLSRRHYYYGRMEIINVSLHFRCPFKGASIRLSQCLTIPQPLHIYTLSIVSYFFSHDIQNTFPIINFLKPQTMTAFTVHPSPRNRFFYLQAPGWLYLK